MILLSSRRLNAADNAGGILFKCIHIRYGFKRRFARLGEIVGSTSVTRKVYSQNTSCHIMVKKLLNNVHHH